MGYAAILTVQVWLSGEEVLTVLVEKYGIWKGAFGRLSPSFPENEVFWLIPVVCLCILYIFGFFDQRGNVGSIWLPSFLFSTVLYLLVQYGGAERALALLCWLIMAGMGLHSVFCPETERKESREKKAEADVPASSALQKEDEFTPGKLLAGDIPQELFFRENLFPIRFLFRKGMNTERWIMPSNREKMRCSLISTGWKRETISIISE